MAAAALAVLGVAPVPAAALGEVPVEATLRAAPKAADCSGSKSELPRLTLANNQLTGPIPPELGNLSALRELGLYGNYLTGPIPAELGNLSNLRSLWLHGNQLTGPIPSELGSLEDLISLQLTRNRLTGCVPAGLAAVVKNIDQLGLEICADS